MLLVGTRAKLKPVLVLPIMLYNTNVLFVGQYNYLGVILDSEMSLRPFYNHVKKNIYVKIFSLLKLSNYLTEHASIIIYI